MVVEAGGRDIFEGEVSGQVRTRRPGVSNRRKDSLKASSYKRRDEGKMPPYLNSLFSPMTCTPCSYEAASPLSPTAEKWPFAMTGGAVGFLASPDGSQQLRLG